MKINFKKLFQARSKDKLSFTPNPFYDWRRGLFLIIFLFVVSGVLHYFLYLGFVTPPVEIDTEPLVKVLNKNSLNEAVRIIEDKAGKLGGE